MTGVNVMLNTTAIVRTYKGTWKEVLTHLDEIPDTTEVELNILSRQSDGEESVRYQKMIDSFVAGLKRRAEKERRSVDEIGEELIRQADFPMIEFSSIYGERIACVKDGMQVWQIIMVARGYPADTVMKTAEHVVLKPEQVRAALDYYAAYPDEIDAALAENDNMTYEKMKRLHPWMKIGLKEITDEDFERLEREYPLEELNL